MSLNEIIKRTINLSDDIAFGYCVNGGKKMYVFGNTKIQ